MIEISNTMEDCRPFVRGWYPRT